LNFGFRLYRRIDLPTESAAVMRAPGFSSA
jgi:hypothetical protein